MRDWEKERKIQSQTAPATRIFRFSLDRSHSTTNIRSIDRTNVRIRSPIRLLFLSAKTQLAARNCTDGKWANKLKHNHNLTGWDFSCIYAEQFFFSFNSTQCRTYNLETVFVFSINTKKERYNTKQNNKITDKYCQFVWYKYRSVLVGCVYIVVGV